MRLVVCLGILSLCVSNLHGQAASTNHVFPRIVDGYFGDGSSYNSTILATNTSATKSTCSLSLFGLEAERLALPTSFSLEASGGYIVNTSRGNAPFAAGYAALNCDQPVVAFVVYQYVSAAASVLGLATVFSAPENTMAQFPSTDASAGYRLGIAIANHTANTEDYVLVLNDSTGHEQARATITLQAHSAIAKFVDEWVSVPARFSGTVRVASKKMLAGISGGEFRALGLLFAAGTFSTIPPVVLAP